MPFLVVEFYDGFSVIPDIWYYAKKNYAKYPPEKLTQMSRNRLVMDQCPPHKHWKSYKVKKLIQTLGNYIFSYSVACIIINNLVFYN